MPPAAVGPAAGAHLRLPGLAREHQLELRVARHVACQHRLHRRAVCQCERLSHRAPKVGSTKVKQRLLRQAGMALALMDRLPILSSLI
jgi:hypothetical protein